MKTEKRKESENRGFFTSLKKWSQSNSLWCYPIINSCCSKVFEKQGSNYSFVKLVENFTESPRHSDVLLLSGVITEKQLPVIKRVYDQMPSPKWVIVVGSCAISGGVFKGYSVICDIEKRIPVDVFIPGCPPSESAICEGLDLLKRKIKRWKK